MNSSINTQVVDDLIRQMSETLNDIDGYYESLVSAVKKKPVTKAALAGALQRMISLSEGLKDEFVTWTD